MSNPLRPIGHQSVVGSNHRQRAYLHYDLERTDYSLSPHELRLLEASGHNSWKEFSLVACSIGLPCAINAAAVLASQRVFELTLGIFLNSLFGGIGLALCLCFSVLWYRHRHEMTNVIERIKQKPKLTLAESDGQDEIDYLSYAVPELPFSDNQ